jgi:hypothetical protein
MVITIFVDYIGLVVCVVSYILAGFFPPISKGVEAGARDKDQNYFTDPQSYMRENSTNDGFDQHYNVQAAVEQNSILTVATSLFNYPNDKQESAPTLRALPVELDKPSAAALDNGFSVKSTCPWYYQGNHRLSPIFFARVYKGHG